MKEDRKMSIVEHALDGKASLWLNLKENFIDYENFKKEFLEEFHSIPIRVRFKKNWMENRYEAQKESLQNYFYKQLDKARYFIPRLSEFETNYNIVQQYPNWVRQTLSTINFTDTNSIVQTLGNLDVVRKEKSWENGASNPHFENKHNTPRINEMRIQGGGYQSQGRRNWNNNQNNNRNNRRRNHGNYSGHYNSNENFHQASSDFRMPDTRFPPPQAKENGFSNPNGNNNGRSNENNLN